MGEEAGVGAALRILDEDRASVRIGTEVGVNNVAVVEVVNEIAFRKTIGLKVFRDG